MLGAGIGGWIKSMKIPSRRVHGALAIISTLLFFLLIPTASAYAGSGPRVRLSEEQINLGTGNERTLSVLAENIPPVYGVDVRLTFDPAILEVVDADETAPGVQSAHGGFIDPSRSFILQNQADNENGTVDYALTLLHPAPPAAGYGEVVRITFRAKADGWATVVLDDVLFGTQSGQTLPPAQASIQASFEATAGGNTAPVSVSFTNTSTGGYVSSFWEFGDGENSTQDSPTHIYELPGQYPAKLTVYDSTGGQSSAVRLLVFGNVPPLAGEITGPTAPLPINSSVTATASFTDADPADTHTAEWDWGDGEVSSGTIVEENGFGTVHGDHIYNNPGVFTVGLSVYDDHGGVGESFFLYVVIYDPGGSFVTGSGKYESPPGAYFPDPDLAGKGRFGFHIRYRHGQSTPSGILRFTLTAVDFRLFAHTFDWLVVFGARSWFQGSGTINWESGYHFLVTAVDGDADPGDDIEEDLFRIKIWHMDGGDSEIIVYDNGFGSADFSELWATPLSRGKIKIHH
jgi:PKD repeat protein